MPLPPRMPSIVQLALTVASLMIVIAGAYVWYSH